ncbi:5-formyltetrahydrofolate cyclo-ligase [Paludibacter sp.]|uniref:5-formyltetrahydrofolate cyclo-ligase n=1 Tax=Paludibacter sp. TaxID=1898105 RepID=UPI0013540BD9|nr:5-formyltetrahydrofolate cyclo-ligase [Paludibacter sp.]MTK53015.1 5-formyltetrahydrofolate cyclo-ligase [Paludibacter sp.]
MGNTAMQNKKHVRALIKERKLQLSKDEQVYLSEKVVQNIEQCEEFHTAHSVLCYWPLSDEVQIDSLIEKFWHEKQFYLPVVSGDKLELKLFEGRDKMQIGAFGILEPTGETYSGDVDLVIVPGVAFDLQGHRLGRGKGYYDQFLPSTKAYKVGVAFRLQIVENIPVDEWDIPVDRVVTD